MRPVVLIDLDLDAIYYSHQMPFNIPEPCKVLCDETCDDEQQVSRKKWKQSQRQRPLAAFAKIRIQKLNSRVVNSSKKPFGAIRTESS